MVLEDTDVEMIVAEIEVSVSTPQDFFAFALRSFQRDVLRIKEPLRLEFLSRC